MPVIRVNKTKDYTVMANYHFRDKNLSLKAKGLLSMMLSLPDGWGYSVEGLVKLSADGRASVMAALNELEKFNYLKRSRARDLSGKLGEAVYDIFEQPKSDFPTLEKPTLEKPTLENRTLLNTNKLNTKVLNTNNKKVSKAQSKPVENFDSIIQKSTESTELREALVEFVKFRKLIKKPMTNKALELIISKINRLGSSDREKVEIINQSIERGWAGVFALRSDEPMQQGRYGQPTQPNPYKLYNMENYGLKEIPQ